MFLNDKYAPKTVLDLTFHKELVDRLFRMSIDNAIPHLILYGPDGAGKRTIARMFLEQLYDNSVNEMSDTVYTVNGSGNTTTDISIKQSLYHIVIDPNNNNFDRYLIQNVVKEYAKRIPLDVRETNKAFKVVLINDVENLSYYAQMSLRRTMEKYSRTCRFLMVCNAISKLIDPLRSRCVCVRVPSPTNLEITNTLLTICHHEKYNLTLENLYNILAGANGNIKQAIWLLEMITRSLTPTNSYIETIDEIIKLVATAKLSSVPDIRTLIYNILITNISGSVIIQTITLKLCEQKNISDSNKFKIIKTATKYEHNLMLGRREIIHLDGFIVDTLLILSKPF